MFAPGRDVKGAENSQIIIPPQNKGSFAFGGLELIDAGDLYAVFGVRASAPAVREIPYVKLHRHLDGAARHDEARRVAAGRRETADRPAVIAQRRQHRLDQRLLASARHDPPQTLAAARTRPATSGGRPSPLSISRRPSLIRCSMRR